MDDLDLFIRDLDGAADRLRDAMGTVVRASTLRTEALGKAGANVRTGAMRASISPEFDTRGDTISGLTGPTVSYAHFPHDGTSRIAPNPFMYRAADVVEPMFYVAAEAAAVRAFDG